MQGKDVLMRGSVPGPLPFLRFIMRAVDEKEELVAGVVVRGIGALGRAALGIEYFDALSGRKTGRKAERFIVGVWCGGVCGVMVLLLVSGNSRMAGMRIHVVSTLTACRLGLRQP